MLDRCVLSFAVALSLGVFGCTSPIDESTDATRSALAVKDGLQAPPITMFCASTRVDTYRPNHTCGSIRATSPGGEWQIERLFPNETDARVYDHFCAYTWVPAASSCRNAPIDALDLDQYYLAPNATTHIAIGSGDVWNIRAACNEGAACIGAESVATERLTDLETPGTLICPPGGGDCWRPSGGSCTTCGVIVSDKAFLIEPGVDAKHSLTFDASSSVNEKSGSAVHQFDIVPTHVVFSVKLPGGVPYDDRIETWGTKRPTYVQVADGIFRK